MVKKLILGGIFGGVVLFAWGALSWMVLPWHRSTIQKFGQENVVEVVLAANAPTAGVYIVPNACPLKTPDKTARQAAQKKAETGPFAFVVVSPKGVGPMKRNMIREFAIQILAAMFITTLLLRLGKTSYGNRVVSAVLFAFAASLVTEVSNWNWWGFPLNFTLAACADLLVGWFLAGLVIAKIAEPGKGSRS